MKKIIPIALIVISALIFCFDRTSKPFEEIEVSDEEVVECNRDIPEGGYDIEVLKGPTEVGVHAMEKGEVYYNYYIRKNSQFFLLNHKGKVKIKEAKRTLLQGKSFKITQMGNYEVGKDISKGTYTVTLSSVPEKENSIGMFLWNEDLDQCLEQYDFQKRNDIVSLTLKEGQILQVYRDEELESAKTRIELEFNCK